MTDLAKLIEAVEEGNLVDYNPEFDSRLLVAFDDLTDRCALVELAFGGSIDAALDLMAELLGDRWILFNMHQYAKQGSWRVILRKFRFLGSFDDQWADNKSPARAILLATLKAYQWEQEQ